MPLHLKESGVIKSGFGLINIAGQWHEPACYVKSGGQWLCVQNAYPNWQLAGGGPSGPSYGPALPPTGHVITFTTVDAIPTAAPGGAFQWSFNPLKVSGRSFLQLQISGLTLNLGSYYRLSYEIDADQNYAAALNSAGLVDVVIYDQKLNVVAGTQTVYIDFAVVGGAPAGSFRVGCGTTSNNTVSMTVRDPRLIQII